MYSSSEVTREMQRKIMRDEVEREHFQLIKETERKIFEEEMLNLKEKLDLQQREEQQTFEERSIPYLSELVNQLETGLLSPTTSSCTQSSLIQGLVGEIRELGKLYKSQMKKSKFMNTDARMNRENHDPGINNSNSGSFQVSNRFVGGFECSPLEEEVYTILKKANDVIHDRIESAYEVITERIRNSDDDIYILSDHKEENLRISDLEAIRNDMDKAKALCKRNLQAAADIACVSVR